MNKRVYIGAGAAVIVILIFLGMRKSAPVEEEPVAARPVNTTAAALFNKANALKEDRNLAEAKAAYQKILNEHPTFERIEEVQTNLEAVNMDLIFSNVPTDSAVTHEVVSGDTLGKLAKQYGTTVDLIKKSNDLKSDIIRIGQRLKIWNEPFNIFVDKSQNILMLKKGQEIIKVYNISTGKDNNTPVGQFTITTRLTDPVWFNRGVVVPPESPENVLGSRWLGFDLPGYGIHGTIEPETIGQQVTAGCVRMRNSDVEELYSMIPTGTQVMIVD